jgi:hypothetical protein
MFVSTLLQAVPSKAMLVIMKNILSNSLLVLALIASSAVYAALYKGVDSEGNVVYSDTPFEEAEKFTPPPISVMDRSDVRGRGDDKTAEEGAEEKKPAVFKYTDFDITSPKNKETIRNQPNLTVTLQLKPGLNTEEDHSIWFLLDGKPVIKNSKGLTLQLGRLERGAHKLQAQVRDKAGKIKVRTRTTVVFVHQTSAL